MINATPISAPFPVAEFLRPDARDHSKISEKSACASEGPCSIPVHVAIFFDGTNNNLYRDKDGVRVGVPDSKGNPTPISPKSVSPESADHSNIARLFLAFPAKKQSEGKIGYYIPGPGTPFPQIGEKSETQAGKAFAKGGQPRILWALFQTLNALCEVVNAGELLYDDEVAAALIGKYDDQVGTTIRNDYDEQVHITHKSWFAEHITALGKKLEKPKPKIPTLTLSVFGFSRGAAEAAAFCHMFDEILVDGKLAGIPAEICFLGVFDTVASVGGSASVARTMFMPGAIFDGHWSWANRILKPLPPSVKAGRHFIASQEVRMNFPVTRLSAECGDFREVYFPGMHSDVGGGYGPGDFGKGRESQSSLVSQIPLAHMFKAARLAGVPFTPFSELEQSVKDDFAVNQDLASAWNAYTAELGQNGGILKKHMELYYRWRAARLKNLEDTTSFKKASEQAQQDMRDSNRMLAGDLEALEYRRTAPAKMSGDGESDPYTPYDLKRINQWHYYRAQHRTPLDEWEAWALSIFRAPQPLPADVMRFFDDYIHDSFAGFYMAGEVTEYDRRVKVSQVLKQDERRLKGFDLKVYKRAKEAEAQLNRRKAGETLSAEENKLADEAEDGVSYPIMSDVDTADMRSAAITTQTSTRREGGGYILRRGYYPHHGFIRESIHEEELQRMPKVGAADEKPTAQEEVPQLVWSDDVMGDILIAARDSSPREAIPEANETAMA